MILPREGGDFWIILIIWVVPLCTLLTWLQWLLCLLFLCLCIRNFLFVWVKAGLRRRIRYTTIFVSPKICLVLSSCIPTFLKSSNVIFVPVFDQNANSMFDFCITWVRHLQIKLLHHNCVILCSYQNRISFDRSVWRLKLRRWRHQALFGDVFAYRGYFAEATLCTKNSAPFHVLNGISGSHVGHIDPPPQFINVTIDRVWLKAGCFAVYFTAI